MTTAEQAGAAEMKDSKYNVPPFSGANYGKNSGKCRGDESPCAICGKPVKDASAKHFATVIGGGSAWGDENSDANDPGYMGGWPVGTDCHRKHVVKEAA